MVTFKKVITDNLENILRIFDKKGVYENKSFNYYMEKLEEIDKELAEKYCKRYEKILRRDIDGDYNREER